jgi:hypothetical protein
MNLKERVQALFTQYNVELAVEEPQQLASAQLESGQEIQTDGEAFSAGAAVFVTNDEGERIPLPDGDYTMQDGATFKVKDGVIAEEEEAPAESPAEAPAADEELSEDQAKQTLQDALRPMVQDMITEAMAPIMEKMSQQEKAVEEMSAEPAAQPVARVKTSAPQEKVDLSQLKNTKDRVKAIQNMYL